MVFMEKGIISSKPKKQRKAHYHRPLHVRQACLCGHLSKQLRKQLGRRSLAIRKGDTVKVLRGGKRGTEGKVIGVDYKKGTVLIDKLVRKKTDGTEIPLPVRASKLVLTDVDKSDARRFKGKKGRPAEGAGEEKKETGEKGKAAMKGKE